MERNAGLTEIVVGGFIIKANTDSDGHLVMTVDHQDGSKVSELNMDLSGSDEQWSERFTTEKIEAVYLKSLGEVSSESGGSSEQADDNETAESMDSSDSKVQVIVDEMVQDLLDQDKLLSGKTKQVHVNLASLTRVEFSGTVSVPVEFDEDKLESLVDKSYDEIDGGDYWEDPDYWEKSDTCGYSIEPEPNVSITCLDEFKEAFPNHSVLEEREGFTRYSNGESENSSYESAWFNDEGELVNNPSLDF